MSALHIKHQCQSVSQVALVQAIANSCWQPYKPLVVKSCLDSGVMESGVARPPGQTLSQQASKGAITLVPRKPRRLRLHPVRYASWPHNLPRRRVGRSACRLARQYLRDSRGRRFQRHTAVARVLPGAACGPVSFSVICPVSLPVQPRLLAGSRRSQWRGVRAAGSLTILVGVCSGGKPGRKLFEFK